MYLLYDRALLQYKMKYHDVIAENENKIFIDVFETKCFFIGLALDCPKSTQDRPVCMCILLSVQHFSLPWREL